MYGKLPNKMGSLNKNESVSKWSYSLFLHKARLSQARALLFPKVFIPLGIQNYNAKDTLSFLHIQPNAKNRQRYCEVPPNRIGG